MSASFSITGAGLQCDSATGGGGLATALFADTGLFLRYDGDLAGSSSNHAVSAEFRFSW